MLSHPAIVRGVLLEEGDDHRDPARLLNIPQEDWTAYLTVQATAMQGLRTELRRTDDAWEVMQSMIARLPSHASLERAEEDEDEDGYRLLWVQE